MKILVVDDEQDVKTLFQQRFRKEIKSEELNFVFAFSGEEALTTLKTMHQEAVLILSDINMPGMSGLELLPVVKQRRPDLPVFMISAYGDDKTVSTALSRGASKFLTKPVDFPQLKQDVLLAVAAARGGAQEAGR